MNQSEVEAMIRYYTEAEMAVLSGKTIMLNGQSMTMENLTAIREGRQEWEHRLAGLLKKRCGQADYCLARF
ncbi:hypothetical protein ACR6A7_00010 [Pantoea sp. RRHST58]|uniref:hypothetical protein n=1 Tax=Pantoea sp. RRHST58 TaxID=3425183 RepID=UPI003D9FD160